MPANGQPLKLSRKLAALAATSLLAAGLATPASADGPECNTTTHCYGVAHYPSGTITAVGVDLWTDCLHLDTPIADVATHELWLITNGGPGTTTWIEGGYIRGNVAGGDTSLAFRIFWAEYTGSVFYSHFVQNAPVATWKNVAFYRDAATNKWNIFVAGTYIATTVLVAANGTSVQAGAETTEPQVYSHGKSRLIQWRLPAGTWTNAGPSSSAGTAGVYSVTASGRDLEQTSLQNMCSPAPLAKRAAKAPTDADLKTAALSVAAAHGEKTPTSLQVVSTTRKAAQRAVGAGQVDSDQATYLVQMKGAFVGRAPQGADLPRGTSMTVTVDAATGEVTDTSLGNDRQDLKTLGAVKAL